MTTYCVLKDNKLFDSTETEEKRIKSDKRELIDFDDLEDFSIFKKKLNVPLTVGYVAPREKYLITPVTHFNINEFFRCSCPCLI